MVAADLTRGTRNSVRNWHLDTLVWAFYLCPVTKHCRCIKDNIVDLAMGAQHHAAASLSRHCLLCSEGELHRLNFFCICNEMTFAATLDASIEVAVRYALIEVGGFWTCVLTLCDYQYDLAHNLLCPLSC